MQDSLPLLLFHAAPAGAVFGAEAAVQGDLQKLFGAFKAKASPPAFDRERDIRAETGDPFERTADRLDLHRRFRKRTAGVEGLKLASQVVRDGDGKVLLIRPKVNRVQLPDRKSVV